MAVLLSGCLHGIQVERGLVFSEPDGETLRANVYQPREEADGLRPGMVVVHGGGWIGGRRTQQAWFCRNFAREGYVVMTCDYRLLPKYAFPYCLYDSKEAVRWLRAHAEEYGIDPDRIVTFGASAGGHLSGLLATTRPEDGLEGTDDTSLSSAVSAAVLLYPAADLTSYRDGDAGAVGKWFAASLAKREYEGDGDPYEWASPLHYVHEGMPPIYIAHGTADALVPHVQSENFHEAIKEAGGFSELHLHENRNHGFDIMFMGEREAMFRDMARFLRDQNGAP